MGAPNRGPSLWRLAICTVAGISLILFFANSDSLSYVQQSMMQTGAAAPARGAADTQPLVGRVGGKLVQLPAAVAGQDAAYEDAFERCRPPAKGDTVPELLRVAAWDGADASRGGNTTVVTTLHVDRLPLLEAHCAVWPHTIVAAVYAPVSAARRVVCVSEADGTDQLAEGSRAWLWWLGRRAGDCPHAGWSVDRLKRRVREVQRRAQKSGQCNLQVQLYTERVAQDMGPAAALLPQAALQNRAMQALQPKDAAEYEAVVLLDSDMVSVDIWQLVNWPSRWERAVREMSAGKALVLPAFQLTPAGVAAAAKRGEPAELGATRAVLKVVTAEAGKFPLEDLYREGRAAAYADHGFAGSQAAAHPSLWFEAGDMHGADDDGYPVVPYPGFAPFTMTLTRHVPWADERLRGSYYQRAWQAVAARALGLTHVVQPNAFAMQLPHDEGYSRGEAALRAFLQMQPVFEQLVAEVGRGDYTPVTSFGKDCPIQGGEARAAASEDE